MLLEFRDLLAEIFYTFLVNSKVNELTSIY